MKWHWLSCRTCRVFAVTKIDPIEFRYKYVCPICNSTDDLSTTMITMEESIANFKFLNFLQGNKNDS